MEGLDSDLIDEFLQSDYDLTGNVFEEDFVLDQITADDHIDFTDELIQGIKEELESWTGDSSASSSPTFSPQNASPGGESSDEEKYSTTNALSPYDSFLRNVVVKEELETKTNNKKPMKMTNLPKDGNDSRDTPSPGSTSSSSGCLSDFSTTTNELLTFPVPVTVLNLDPGSLIVQQPQQQFGAQLQPSNMQFVQIPPVASTAQANTVQKPIIQVQPTAQGTSKTTPKTVILSQEEFGQLMKKMQVTKAPPRIQTVVQRPIAIVPNAAGEVKPKPVVTHNQTRIPNERTLICSPNQVLDEKTYRKQQRLIRNRESANQSRRKKKEFVDSLQETIQQISAEKEHLMNENNQLRTQLLNNVCSRCNQKIAAANGRNGRNHLKGLVNKKNSFVVLAMLLTVSLNFGPINNMLSSTQSRDLSSNGAPLQSISNDEGTLRRHILWAGDDSSGENVTNSFPDIHANTSQYPKCTNEQGEQQQQYINQTENIRIASELRRWIGEPEYLNLTREYSTAELASLGDVKRKRNDLEYDDNFLVNMLPKKYWKNRKMQQKRNKKMERFALGRSSRTTTTTSEVDVFRPTVKRVEAKYAELFAELRRKDDTFYVVSFNADHLMLPALDYNKTERPKMSLMFPAIGFNDSLNDDHIMMMQIDCEVLDTTLIQVREKLIPEHLRTRFQNGTAATTVNEETMANRQQGEKNVTREFGPQPQLLRRNASRGAFVKKPYFVENPRFGNVTGGD